MSIESAFPITFAFARSILRETSLLWVMGGDSLEFCRSLGTNFQVINWARVGPAEDRLIDFYKRLGDATYERSEIIIENFTSLTSAENAVFRDFLSTRFACGNFRVLIPLDKEHEIEEISYEKFIRLPDFPEHLEDFVKCSLSEWKAGGGICDDMEICSLLKWRRFEDVKSIIRQTLLAAIENDKMNFLDLILKVLIKRGGTSGVGLTQSWDSFEGDEAIFVDLDSALQKSDRPVVLAISGPSGSGKTFLCQLIAEKFNAPPVILKPADLLDAVVGSSEKKLASLLKAVSNRGGERLVVVFEDCDILFPNDKISSKSIRRLLPTLLSLIDRASNRLVLLFTACEIKDLSHRLRRRSIAEIRLTGVLDEHQRERLIRRFLSRGKVAVSDEIVKIAISVSKGFSGAAIDRLVREAGVKAIRRGIRKGSTLEFSPEDFIANPFS